METFMDTVRLNEEETEEKSSDPQCQEEITDSLNGKTNTSGKKPTLASRLQLFRSLRDLTQDELANAIGVSKDKVASWETGRKNPNPKSLSILARFFDITEDYLSCKTDFPTNADYSDVTTWGGSNVQLAVKFAKEFDLLSVESRLKVMALIIDLREREDRQKSYEVEQRVAAYKTKSKRKKEDYREELWEQHIDEDLRPPQKGKTKN